MDYVAVSQAARRFEDRIRRDKRVLNMKDAIVRVLKKADNVKR